MVKRADPLAIERPALLCLELSSIARGIVVLDQMAKRAETTIVCARSFSPGRYLILLSGLEAEIEEAGARGVEIAGEDLLDHLILYDPAPGLREILGSEPETEMSESLAIVETHTLSAALLAADKALKSAEIVLLELRLGAGLCGKGLFSFSGALHMAEAACEAIRSAISPEKLMRIELIAKPHPDLPAHLLGAEPALVRGKSV